MGWGVQEGGSFNEGGQRRAPREEATWPDLKETLQQIPGIYLEGGGASWQWAQQAWRLRKQVCGTWKEDQRGHCGWRVANRGSRSERFPGAHSMRPFTPWQGLWLRLWDEEPLDSFEQTSEVMCLVWCSIVTFFKSLSSSSAVLSQLGVWSRAEGRHVFSPLPPSLVCCVDAKAIITNVII